MSGQLFYSGVIGFGLGIALRSFFDIGEAEILLTLVVSLGVGVILRRGSTAPAAPYVLLVSVFLLTTALGMLRLEHASQGEFVPALEAQVEEMVTLEGVVVREPDQRQSSVHLYVETEHGIVLITTDRYRVVEYGDRIVAEGKLRRPETFETDLGRTFNYPGYLQARGVSYLIRFAQVDVVGEDEGNVVLATLLDFKGRFMDSVEQVIPEPQAGLGEGLLLGVKQALGEDLETDFRRTGIIHIVVLSGYNVMIVAEAIMRLLAYFFNLRTRVLIGVVAISAFALMVGLGATVLRASLMAILVLIARATGRTYAIMRALMLAGVAMLLLNPYLLAFDPGFQLSFLATLALILLAPHIESWLGFVPTRLQIREFLTATVSTQIFVLPLLLYAIGELSIVSVLVNVLVLPMVPIAMGLTFVTGLLGMASPSAALPLAFLSHLSLSYIIILAEFFGSFSLAAFSVPTFPFWVVLLAYALMGWALYHLHARAARRNTEVTASDVIEKQEAQESDEDDTEVLEDYSQWTIEAEVIKSNT